MTHRKKYIISHYTIVEVMMAMGIFLVMMTIMMQFFTSAQKVWNLASKKNMLYADARVAMNLMTRELQSMLYDNDSDGSGIYPFWYQCTDIDECYEGGKKRPTELKSYFKDNNDLPNYNGNLYLNVLNFISTTDLKDVDEGSDVCEIRYRFIPVYFETDDPQSMNEVLGGRLERSCVSEYSDKTPPATGTDLSNTVDSANTPYNFASIPCYGDLTQLAAAGTYNIPLYQNRVANIWESEASASTDNTDVKTSISDAKYRTVITGVYSLRFTCYYWDSSGGKLEVLAPMDSSGNGLDGGSIGSPLKYDLAVGTPKPVAVRIDMKLMDPKDLRELTYNIYLAGKGSKTAEKQVKVLTQRMRNFSKVIYLEKNDN